MDPDGGGLGPLVTTGSGGAGGGSPRDGGSDGSGPERAEAGGEDAASGTCFDGARNSEEAGVDCGGGCAPCSCSLGAPERLDDPNYPGSDLWSPKLSSDGLRLYFGLTIPGFAEQIAVATRPDRSSPFGPGEPLPAPINQGKEGTPYLTLDGLSLYFYSERAGGAGSRDLYVATRPSSGDAFAEVTPLSSVNTSELDYLPWLTADALTLYFASGPAGSADIHRSTRASPSDAFGPPEAVTELNTPSDEGGVTLSSDGLEIILASNRPGGAGARDLYRATRASPNEPFPPLEPLEGLNSPENEIDPAFSPDGAELYFASSRGGGESALYRSVRSCAR